MNRLPSKVVASVKCCFLLKIRISSHFTYVYSLGHVKEELDRHNRLPRPQYHENASNRSMERRNVNNNHIKPNSSSQNYMNLSAQSSNSRSFSPHNFQGSRSPRRELLTTHHYMKKHALDEKKFRVPEASSSGLSQKDLISENQKAFAEAFLNYSTSSYSSGSSSRSHHSSTSSNKQPGNKRTHADNAPTIHSSLQQTLKNNENRSPFLQRHIHDPPALKRPTLQHLSSIQERERTGYRFQDKTSASTSGPPIKTEPIDSHQAGVCLEYTSSKRRSSNLEEDKGPRIAEQPEVEPQKHDNLEKLVLDMKRKETTNLSEEKRTFNSDVPLNLSRSLGKPDSELDSKHNDSVINSKLSSSPTSVFPNPTNSVSNSPDREANSKSPKLTLSFEEKQKPEPLPNTRIDDAQKRTGRKSIDKKPSPIDLSGFSTNFEPNPNPWHNASGMKGANPSLLTYDGRTINTPDLVSRKTPSDANTTFFPPHFSMTPSPMVSKCPRPKCKN